MLALRNGDRLTEFSFTPGRHWIVVFRDVESQIGVLDCSAKDLNFDLVRANVGRGELDGIRPISLVYNRYLGLWEWGVGGRENGDSYWVTTFLLIVILVVSSLEPEFYFNGTTEKGLGTQGQRAVRRESGRNANLCRYSSFQRFRFCLSLAQEIGVLSWITK